MDSSNQKSQLMTDASIVDLYNQLITVLEDPASYRPDEPKESESDGDLSKALESIMGQLTATASNKETGSSGSSQVIDTITSKLPELIATFSGGEMQFNPDGFKEYLTEMSEKLSKNAKACSRFVFNLEFVQSLESQYDGQEIPTNAKLMDLLGMFICKGCKFPVSSHPVCGRYNKTGSNNVYLEDLCSSCGMQEHYHQVCKSFTFVSLNGKLQKTCTTCGKGHYDHIKRLEKEGVKLCSSFKDNSFGYCKTCCRHINAHMYNQKHRTMNNHVKDNFSTKSLQLTVKILENPEYKALSVDIQRRIVAPDVLTLMALQQQHGYHNIL